MKSEGEVGGGVCGREVGQDGDFDVDIDMAVVTISVPSVMGDGRTDESEFVRANSLCGLFPLDASLELGEGPGGREVTGEGFSRRSSLDRS